MSTNLLLYISATLGTIVIVLCCCLLKAFPKNQRKRHRMLIGMVILFCVIHAFYIWQILLYIYTQVHSMGIM